MNLFLEYQIKFINILKKLEKNKLIFLPPNINSLVVEAPPKQYVADMSCNAVMLISKFNEKSPNDLGQILKRNLLENFDEFEKIEIAKQGFINISFKSSFWKDYLLKVIKLGSNYGSNKEIKKKYNLEFVSANPTGPLHVGHCRGAILGDALSNLLKFNGNLVTKEYYVNDYGLQIKNFTESIYYRILEIKENKKFPENENLYPGDYIIDIANKIIQEKLLNDFQPYYKIENKLTEVALNISMGIIKKNLNDLGIQHDIFVYESEFINKKLVSKTIEKLKKDNLVYKGKLLPPKGEENKIWKSREQLLFKSSKFGDDQDRSLQKEDGSWTYFASDIAYHSNKIDRGFDILINILGADHSGYIKRISAATKAVSKDKTKLICKVSQLVKLFKKGKPFKMSKRKGDYITVNDLVVEVGLDAARFMMLNRSNDAELEFDFEKVTEKSKDNPVYYVQYAYARINSIFRAIKMDLNTDIPISDKDFILNEYEINILKKISQWPRCVQLSSNKLEPHRIPFYLYDLVTLFHSYWNLGKENKKFRFISDNGKLNNSRLILLQALSIVIKNGMSILGVSTPKSM